MMPFPESARVLVASALANDLFHAATKLPPYDDKALYDVKLQVTIHDEIQLAQPDGFQWLVEEIRTRLVQAPYSAYITGLKLDKANLLFIALSRTLGDVVDPYKQPWSKLVRYIRPSTDRSVTGQGVLNEQLHTDGTDWPQPNDFTCLLCKKPDQNGGGRSRLMDIETILAELQKNFGTEVIDHLRHVPVPWGIADELGGGVVWFPILRTNNLRWLRYTINIGLDKSQYDLSELICESLAAMESVTATAESELDLAMEANSLLIIDNKRCLHARTEIPHPKSSQRLILRTKVLVQTNE